MFSQKLIFDHWMTFKWIWGYQDLMGIIYTEI